MKKKILFIISGLILAGLIFCGGIYFDQRVLLATKTQSEAQSDFYHYFFASVDISLIDGFGIIKDIDVDNSIITLASQIDENKTLKVNIVADSAFFQTIVPEEGKLDWTPLVLEDLKVNDKVYFACRLNKDGSFDFLRLNVESK